MLSCQYVLYLMLYYIIMCLVPAVQVPLVGCLYSQVLSNSKFLNSERHVLMNEMTIFFLLQIAEHKKLVLKTFCSCDKI